MEHGQDIYELLLVVWAARYSLLVAAILVGLPLYAQARRRGFLVAITATEWSGTVATVAVGYVWLHPDRGRERTPPLVFYMWFLLAIAGLLLPGMSFFFDYYRAPVVGVLLAFAGVSAGILGRDHLFDVTRIEVPRATVEKAIERRRALHGLAAGTPAIFACASGGGIQAAAWTSRVLTGLQQELGDGFARALALISGVSGGSVGALCWAHGVDRGRGIPHPSDLEEIFRTATRPSLDEIAWGLAFAEGTLPVIAFNTVTVEQGRHVVISSAGTFGQGELSNDFESLYEDDLQPAPLTAARLSATFPFVTPVARARCPGGGRLPTWHFADGGFFDNGAVYTAVRAAAEWLAADGSRRAVILEIEAFPLAPRSRPDTSFGWVRNTLAPMETLIAMRSAAQRERNRTEAGLLAGAFSGRVERIVLQPRGGQPPLSWHLDPADIRAIQHAWEEVQSSADVRRLASMLGEAR